MMGAPMTDIKRYDRYGWDYGRHNPLEEKAVRWYLRHAGEVGGEILEVACGTGSLLVPLARAGHRVTGLDLSRTMLAIARERIDALPPKVAALADPIRGDMSDFDLGRRFSLAILADNSFRELETREELLACLRCIRRHLEPGGRFLLTEVRFNPDLYENDRRSLPWTDGYPHPETGESVRRAVRQRLDPDHTKLHGLMIYETTAADGTVSIEECPYEAPILLPADYLDMLSRAGFSPRLFMDYSDRPDDGVDPILCFVSDAT